MASSGSQAEVDRMLREAIDNAVLTAPSHYAQKSYDKTPASRLKSRMLDRKAHRTLMVLERKYRRLRNSTEIQNSKQRKGHFAFEDDHSARHSVSSTGSKGKVYGLTQEMQDAVSLSGRGTKRKTESLPPGLQFGAPHIKPLETKDVKFNDDDDMWNKGKGKEAASSLRIFCTFIVIIICLCAILLVVYLADDEGTSSIEDISTSVSEAFQRGNYTEATRSIPVYKTISVPTTTFDQTFVLSNYQWDEQSLIALLNSNGISSEHLHHDQAFRWKLNEDTVPALTESRVLQRYLLASIYFALGGSTWKNRSGWLTNSHECGWFGLHCGNDRDDQNQAFLEVLTHINLSGNNLIGKMPMELSLFRMLSVLNLSKNDIYGSIPAALIGNLDKLKSLSLSNNQLEGSIPDHFKGMQMLEHLSLADNSLSGRFPSSFSTSLVDLRLTNNELTGHLPDIFTKMSNLRVLAAGNNHLSGHLPGSIGLIPRLQSLYLYENRFSGTIPDFISTELEYVHLDNNYFTGPIPFMESDDSLSELRLGNNQLEDVLPVRLGDLSNLRILHLEDNKLVGGIPHQLGYLENLLSFRIDGNSFSGAVPGSVCDLVDSYSLSQFNPKCGQSNTALACSCCDTYC